MQQAEKNQQQSIGLDCGHDGRSGKTLQFHEKRKGYIAVAGSQRHLTRRAAGVGPLRV